MKIRDDDLIVALNDTDNTVAFAGTGYEFKHWKHPEGAVLQYSISRSCESLFEVWGIPIVTFAVGFLLGVIFSC